MTSLPNYQIKKVIGSGCFGYVFEAFDKTHNKKVALKRIEKVGTQISRQYQVLFKIRESDHIVKILDFFYSKTQSGRLIQNIIFEYIESNLEHIIDVHKNGRIPQSEIKSIMYQILKGLQHIHSMNISHRDLKPENVLISNNGIVKICDFGSSKIINENGQNTPYIVSRYYRSPQLILCLTNYSTAIDIWAVGCILAQLYLLRPLFKGKSEGDQIFAAFKILGSFSSQQKSYYKQQVPFDYSLLDEMNQFDRIDLKAQFPMVQDYDNFIDLLLKMLQYVPFKRITASQALKHPYFNSIRHNVNNY